MLPYVIFAAALAAQEIKPNDPPPTNSNACPVDHLNLATLVNLHLLDERNPGGPDAKGAGIDIQAPAAPPAPPPADLSPGPAAYARIVARYTPCVTQYPREYARERRNVFRRFLMHKTVSKLLSVDVDVKPIAVKASRPLISITRDSGKQGETWTTDVDNLAVILPYFRIERNTTVKVNLSFHSAREYQSSVASDSLEVMKRAATLIKPTSNLVTLLNKGRFNEAATFVDETINGLLKVAMEEDIHVEPTLTGRNQTLASFILYAPGANDPYPRHDWQGQQALGKWTIEAEAFAGSLFGGFDQSGPSAIPAASAVLNFRVSDEKSVGDHLRESNNVRVAHDALLNADSGAVEDNAHSLCRAVADEADLLGFSRDDVEWIVAAYVVDLAVPRAAITDVRAGCGFNETVTKMMGQDVSS